LRNRSNKIH